MDQHPPARIAAVATAFHPDAAILRVLDAAGAGCATVVVVDNTPGGSDLLDGPLPARVEVLRPDGNLGLAGALNLGLAQLDDTVEAVLFLDQDSVLPEDAIQRLAAHLGDPTVGAVGPAPWDGATGSFIDPRTRLRADVAERDAIITSGMLVRRSLLDEVGGFRTEFFVDCVDQDFCLRLRRAGHRIVQDKRIRLPHALGETREHRFLIARLRVTHHPTWRLYWVMRNGVILVREHARRAPLWCLASVLIMGRWVLLTALYERPRRARLRAIRHGLRDGLRGRLDRTYLPGGASMTKPAS
jgi:rhamnosyltransferase